MELRARLILEEAAEVVCSMFGCGEGTATWLKAEFAEYLPDLQTVWAHRPDINEVGKELADLKVVTEGAALEYGIPLDSVFAEVHRSNMSKLMPDGTARLREDGKVLKGPNYRPADVAGVLERFA